MESPDRHRLGELAQLYGVQTAYYDASHKRRQASLEALLAVLRALDAPLRSLDDAPAAIRERQQALWRRLVPPVAVAWDGGPAALGLRLPEASAHGGAACQLELEAGGERSWKADLSSLSVRNKGEACGQRYVELAVELPAKLPPGYHRVRVEAGGRTGECLVISAPRRAYAPENRGHGRPWGVFTPLYSLRSRHSWGCGDLSDLASLAQWSAGLGCRAVATLPLLATFLDEPFEPSPYMPASRLFWNELFIDVARVPELARSEAARSLVASSAFEQERERLRSAPLVDYRGTMGLKRQVLEELGRAFHSGAPEARQAAFRRFLTDTPQAEEYARFRASVEHRRAAWQEWPERMRDGTISPGDYSEEAAHYHLYVQWLAAEQMESLAGEMRQRGQRLYLDLPLGVHPAGFDVWRERDLFARGVSAGAPPDAFFTLGQNWLFPPPHPEEARDQGYQYLRSVLAHHMRHASILRIDHVMGLHRLFWVPEGVEATEGVYVRYPAEEQYAILCLESHRHRCQIVGEDLGVVPPYVRPAMAEHNIARLYTLQFSIDAKRQTVHTPPRGCVASINTHDMPPFAAFWRGLDVRDRRRMGLLDESGMQTALNERGAQRRVMTTYLVWKGLLRGPTWGVEAIVRGCLAFLAGSPAGLVLVNLEDLWGETQPQNVPGTGQERPNWRRKARHRLEALSSMPRVVETLRELDRLRRAT